MHKIRLKSYKCDPYLARSIIYKMRFINIFSILVAVLLIHVSRAQQFEGFEDEMESSIAMSEEVPEPQIVDDMQAMEQILADKKE